MIAESIERPAARGSMGVDAQAAWENLRIQHVVADLPDRHQAFCLWSELIFHTVPEALLGGVQDRLRIEITRVMCLQFALERALIFFYVDAVKCGPWSAWNATPAFVGKWDVDSSLMATLADRVSEASNGLVFIGLSPGLVTLLLPPPVLPLVFADDPFGGVALDIIDSGAGVVNALGGVCTRYPVLAASAGGFGGVSRVDSSALKPLTTLVALVEAKLIIL